MYSLYFTRKVNGVIESLCFYDDGIPTTEYKVISPNLNKKAGNAGSLTFTLPPTNIWYDYISQNIDTVEFICYKDDNETWRGRAYNKKEDFYKQNFMTCEGELTYLNDTTMGYQKFGSSGQKMTVYTFIDRLLSFHNSKNEYEDPNDNVTKFLGPYDKRFYRGYWPTIQDSGNVFETKGETVLDLINSIAKEYNVYPKVTWANRGEGLKRYLDFERGSYETAPNNMGETTSTIVDGETTDSKILINGTLTQCYTNDYVTDQNEHKHIYNGSVWYAYDPDAVRGRYFNQVLSQKIEFGYNLLDFTRSFDPTQIVTAVTMRGSKKDTADGSEAYYDLSTDSAWSVGSIMHQENKPFVYNATAVQNLGWREAMLEVETTEDDTIYLGVTTTAIVAGHHNPTSIIINNQTVAVQNGNRVFYNNVEYLYKNSYWEVYVAPAIEQLRTISVNYLRVNQYDAMSIEISAADLNLMGVNTDSFDIFYDVEVVSYPHGIDRYFPIIEITVPLDKPEEAVFKMGVTQDITLTGSGQRANQEFYDLIKSMPTEETVLNAAKSNANQLIKGALSGYITIRRNQAGQSDAIIIATAPDDGYKTSSCWVWNMGGLGYFPEGWDGTTLPNNAMTSDGSIVADRITTGTLMASLIHGNQIVLSDDLSSNYVVLSKNAFEGFLNINGNQTEIFHITPMASTTEGINTATDYMSLINIFDSKETWVGTTYLNNEHKVSRSGNALLTFGSDVNRQTRGIKTQYNTRDDNYNYTSTTVYGNQIKLWRVPIGGHYLSFINGLLVQDEVIAGTWATAPDGDYDNSPYYTGNITIDNTTYKVKNGMITNVVDSNQT